MHPLTTAITDAVTEFSNNHQSLRQLMVNTLVAIVEGKVGPVVKAKLERLQEIEEHHPDMECQSGHPLVRYWSGDDQDCPACVLLRRIPGLGESQAAKAMAVGILRAVDAGRLDSRSAAGDALLSWTDIHYGVSDGSGVKRLRDETGDVRLDDGTRELLAAMNPLHHDRTVPPVSVAAADQLVLDGPMIPNHGIGLGVLKPCHGCERTRGWLTTQPPGAKGKCPLCKLEYQNASDAKATP